MTPGPTDSAETQKPRPGGTVLPLLARVLGYLSIAWVIALFLVVPVASLVVELERTNRLASIALTSAGAIVALLGAAWAVSKLAGDPSPTSPR